MKKIKLGSSSLQVSKVCLGSMTWGEQNTEADAYQQLDYAIGQGINFIDTAEMYAVPPKSQTCGLTETYIGNWLAKTTHKRDDLVIATKIAGIGVPWIRDGGAITAQAIKQAVDGSLQRLQTDYIDLYQLHWANRPGPHFSKHWPGILNYHEINTKQEKASHLEILQALDEVVKAGKVRYCGLSNDTPWGVNQYLQLARQHNLPSMVSLQNEFSLLHLTDIPHVMETCVMENVAYLPWSPLAGGALTGKYRHGNKPKGCRWTMVQRNGIFRDTTYSHEAIEAYYQIAQDNNLTLAQLALAWVYQYRDVSATIIGATSISQLQENISAYALTLNADTLAAIDTVIRKYPIPF